MERPTAEAGSETPITARVEATTDVVVDMGVGVATAKDEATSKVDVTSTVGVEAMEVIRMRNQDSECMEKNTARHTVTSCTRV